MRKKAEQKTTRLIKSRLLQKKNNKYLSTIEITKEILRMLLMTKKQPKNRKNIIKATLISSNNATRKHQAPYMDQSL